MICKKCGNEVSEDEKFCSKCGKKVKRDNKNTNKHKKWFIVISTITVIIIIGVAVGIGINIKNNSNTVKDNQDSTIANKEIVIIDEGVIREAKYNFTLEDVKRSMDNTCKQNNTNNYTDFEESVSETEVINYISYKNEDDRENGERIEVETVDNYVLSITFVYPDSVKNQNLSGSEDVFFNILKDNGTEEYSNKIKSIITELPMNKNQYYNNTLCYKGYYEVDKATVYSISATSERSYNAMKEGSEEIFITDESDTAVNEDNTQDNKVEKFLKYNMNKDDDIAQEMGFNYIMFRNGQFLINTDETNDINIEGSYTENGDTISLSLDTDYLGGTETVKQLNEGIKQKSKELGLNELKIDGDNLILDGKVTNGGNTFILDFMGYQLEFNIDENDKLQKEQEQNSQDLIERVINAYAKITTEYDGYSLRYLGYTVYAKANDGTVVYQIEYTTGFGLYYERLVSLDKSNTRIDKKSDLIKATQGNEMMAVKGAYETIWGIASY